jgi:hypothetical protein
MKTKKLQIAVLAVLSLMGAARLLHAQIASGTIVGTAYDQSGAIVGGVEIILTNTQTQLRRSVVTDAAGNFTAPQLPVGVYKLSGSAASFKRQEVENITLLVNQTVRVDLRFQVGEVTEEVVVQASPVAVEGETSSVGQVIERERIVDLPLNGRNFMQLANISSGVVPAYNARSATITNQSGREDLAVHVSGGRGDTNSYLLDGVEMRSSWFNSPSILISVDAAQEFKIQKNLFSGDYGQGSGIVSMVTRSGGNDFHGSVYEFFRNDKLDAANFFDNFNNRPKSPLRYNQFGASAGGAIIKNRLFFFGNYEGFRNRRSSTLTALVPTRAQLNGNLAGLPSTKTVAGVAAIVDPLTGQPFSGNVIPADRMSQIARNFVQYIPEPTPGFSVAGRNTVATRSRDRDDDQFTARLDYTLSEKDSFFGRYTDFDSSLENPGLPPFSGSFFPYAGKNFIFQETHVFSPRTLNVVKLGYNRAKVFNSWFPADSSLATEIGLKNLNQVPAEYGLPSFSVTQGYTLGGGGGINQGGIDNLYQISDTLSLNRGRHNISLGVDFRAVQFQLRLGLNNNGAISYDGRYSGSSVADFLLGYVSSATAQMGLGLANWRSKSTNLFLADDIKLTPRLTLNLGLRYEYDTPFSEIDGKEGYFDTSKGQLIVGLSENQTPLRIPNVVLDPNLRPGIWFKDTNNFAPRIGLAYRLTNTAAIRAGYGVFYAKTQGNELQFKINTPPTVVAATLVGSLTTPNVLADRDLFPDPASPSFPVSTLSPFSVDPLDRTPYLQQWNLSWQQELPGQLLGEVAYVGSVGHKLTERTNINQAVPPANPASPTPIAERRPFRNFGDILSALFQENSNYNSLQARLERRFSNGLAFLQSYTWSHSIDTASRGSGGSWHQNIRNLRDDRGSSDFDVRHRLASSFSYQLPFGRGRSWLSNTGGVTGKLVEGWQVHGIASFNTGNTFSVTVSGDRANVGGFPFQRANRSCDGNLPRGERTILRYIDTSCFVVTPLGTFGNAGRNVIEIPGLNNWDLSLFKDTQLTESFKLQFRAEFYNAFNHTQFGQPDLGVQSAFFGQISSARAAREIQFGLKLLW